jgi:hypothetical protein
MSINSDNSDILVSVVVPAYNAEATLAETLASISRQRHRMLEILIIDDGSTDNTSAIAVRFCELDPRARILAQANSGVAAARNLGLRNARGDYVAPIDADDLWHPEHLTGLVARMRQPSPVFGFVCARFRQIDRASRIVGSAPPIPRCDNAVDALLRQNFVGNGSAMLLNRNVALEAGGYEERLRLAGLEGCEDYLLQLRIADRHPVAVVDAFTVGYRRLPTSMSSNTGQMIGSEKMALTLFFSERHETVPSLKRLRAGHARAMARDQSMRGRRWAAAFQLLRALALDFAGTCGALVRQALFAALERGDPVGLERAPFAEVHPQAILDTPLDRARRWTFMRRGGGGTFTMVPSARGR